VAYVDCDPVVVGHAEALLAHNQNVIVTGGDLRHPEGIIECLKRTAARQLSGVVACYARPHV
jgi:hypothetical protein